MTRTRYGATPWIEEFPKSRRPEFPRFRGDLEHPLVIIGGGLTGVLTAYACAAAGLKPVVLEAGRLGDGGASRGPGILQGEAAPSYRDLEQRYGRRAARALFEASRRAVLDLAATARRLKVPGAVTGDALRALVAYTAEEKPFLRELTLRRDAGLDAVHLKVAAAARETHIDGVRAAVRLRGWGVADPYRLLVAFARAAATRGARFFERSAVTRVKAARRHVDVVVEGGTLRTQTVVVCTGEPTGLFPSLRRHVRAEDRYVVLTERIPAPVRKQVMANASVVTDAAVPPHWLRWLDDGRLLMAGADQPRPPARTRDKVLVQRTGQLMYELSRLYPAVSGIMPAYGWDLPMAATADGVMVAGPHRNYPRHLFAWATGHDPAQAFLASRILLRHLVGEPDAADAFFAFTRG